MGTARLQECCQYHITSNEPNRNGRFWVLHVCYILGQPGSPYWIEAPFPAACSWSTAVVCPQGDGASEARPAVAE